MDSSERITNMAAPTRGRASETRPRPPARVGAHLMLRPVPQAQHHRVLVHQPAHRRGELRVRGAAGVAAADRLEEGCAAGGGEGLGEAEEDVAEVGRAGRLRGGLCLPGVGIRFRLSKTRIDKSCQCPQFCSPSENLHRPTISPLLHKKLLLGGWRGVLSTKPIRGGSMKC